MNRYARVIDGRVVEFADVEEEAELAGLFPEEALLRGQVIPAPADARIGWSFDGTDWAGPDLQSIKAALCHEIDTEAERQRSAYVTLGSGQAMEYQQAATEAAALLAALDADPEYEPETGEYPMLDASLGLDGETLVDVATTVAAMHEQWQAIGSAIREARLQGKAAVKAAATEAAAITAARIDWPMAD